VIFPDGPKLLHSRTDRLPGNAELPGDLRLRTTLHKKHPDPLFKAGVLAGIRGHYAGMNTVVGQAAKHSVTLGRSQPGSCQEVACAEEDASEAWRQRYSSAKTPTLI